MNSRKAIHILRNRIARFSNIVSEGSSLRAQCYVDDMPYGIKASQSVPRSKVSRALEELSALLKTEVRQLELA